VKRFVKWVFYILAATFGSELGSRFEAATMTIRIFLDGKEIKSLALKELGHLDRLSTVTDVDFWGVTTFSVPGSWVTYVPGPLFAILCLIVAWRLLRNW